MGSVSFGVRIELLQLQLALAHGLRSAVVGFEDQVAQPGFAALELAVELTQPRAVGGALGLAVARVRYGERLGVVAEGLFLFARL